jgi:hypothetical protein
MQDFRENVMKICILQNLVRKKIPLGFLSNNKVRAVTKLTLEQFSGNVKRLEKNMHFRHAGFHGKCYKILYFAEFSSQKFR